jgi:hypothetical protein
MGKMYNLCKVKTDISAVLTVKSGLDTHRIKTLKDDLNRYSLFIYVVVNLSLYLFKGWCVLTLS